MRLSNKLLFGLYITCLFKCIDFCVDARADEATLTRATIELQGTLIGEDGQPTPGGKVAVNDVQATLDINGDYSVTVSESAIYLVKYGADQFYPIIHTLDHGEITALDGKLPTVTLVKKKPGRVMFAFGGDTMMGRRFKDPFPGEPRWIRPGHELADSKALLEHIKAYTELADYTSVNLESTLMDQEPPKKAEKSYTFFSHPETLPALAWAGVDFVSLGNNHTNDYLKTGLEATISALEKSPLSYAGAGLNAAQALAAHHEAIQGVDFSFLGFVSWKGNSTPSQVAEGENKGGAAYGTQENIVTAVEKEAVDNRVVIVQYHGGSEYSYSPSERTTSRLKAAIDHGADLVIGHHPHVLQGFELYKDKLIAYSLGNFLFDQYRYETQRSAMVYVWMDGESFHRAEIVPIHIQNYHVTPATGKVRDFVIRRLLHQSASNGIRFKVSGGHGVIESTQSTADDMQSAAPINLPQKYPETGLRRLPIYWYQVPFALQTTRDKRSYRFGRDILLLGDFEQHRLFGLVDTDWQFNRDDSGVTDTFSHEGRYALKIAPPVSPDASVARQKYFLRFIDATPSSSMSLTGYAKSTGAARLSVCLDLWPSKWGRTQAIRNPQEKCLKTIDVAKDEWQQFDVDFGPLGTSLKGFRVCLKNERNDHAAESTILVDDLALIIWETKEQPRKDGLDRRISNRHNYLYLENGGQPNSPSVLKVTDLTTPRPAR